MRKGIYNSTKPKSLLFRSSAKKFVRLNQRLLELYEYSSPNFFLSFFSPLRVTVANFSLFTSIEPMLKHLPSYDVELFSIFVGLSTLFSCFVFLSVYLEVFIQHSIHNTVNLDSFTFSDLPLSLLHLRAVLMYHSILFTVLSEVQLHSTNLSGQSTLD